MTHRWSALLNGDALPMANPSPIACAVLSEVDLVAVGFVIETGGQPADQPGRCRPEHAEPERFDVARAGVVAVVVDDGVVPRSNRDDG